jgi:phosphate ABC transporter phosphate-binding protein
MVLFVTANLRSQTAQELSQVKKLNIGQVQGRVGSAELRNSLIKNLRKTGGFELVEKPEQADAVLEGAGQLWIKGHIAINPRAPQNNRQTVYGGYLSVEVTGKDHEVLWSYLATPSNLAWGGVTDDLSKNVIKELIAGRNQNNQMPTMLSSAKSIIATTLHGAGATFPAPLYQKWVQSYQRQYPQIHINYDAVGSESGIRLLDEGKVDFAASDVPPSPSSSTNFRRVASVLGGVVPVYNLGDLDRDLKFTPEILAGIYLGKIHKWNDPALKNANSGVALPDRDIIVFHRSDGSGTSYAWSDYLSKVSADWKTAVGTGTMLHWPIGNGAERNEGIAEAVQRTPGSIGYVELVYAIQYQLSFGAVRNRSGKYVRASLDSLAEAAKENQSGRPLSSITDPASKGAYPIATFTWLLVPQEIKDANKKAALVEFIRWALTTGQNECSALGYTPLSQDIVAQQLELINKF